MSSIIIPAYKPDEKLIDVIQEIKKYEIRQIIVVNDGSGIEFNNVFDQIKDDVVLLTHEQNCGKGRAIKTALKYILEKNINDKILIMDADGQHKIQDGVKLLNALDTKQNQLVLGKRDFKGEIPLRSKIGNTITKYTFRLFSGHWVEDTQTGLRAFNSDLVELMANIKGERYEYETNVLIKCIKSKVELKEVEIETIYINENSSSHFRAVRDSIRIYIALIVSALKPNVINLKKDTNLNKK